MLAFTFTAAPQRTKNLNRALNEIELLWDEIGYILDHMVSIIKDSLSIPASIILDKINLIVK